MNTHHHSFHHASGKCCSCMSRRQCVSLLSLAALGFVMGKSSRYDLKSIAPDFVDATKLRPKPGVRITYAVYEEPRPYWLGWPGTTYDLDTHQKEYRTKLDVSCKKLGLTAECEPQPINDEAGMAALLNKVKETKPDCLLLTLQHIYGWRTINKLIKPAELKVPLIIFAPVGVAFTQHLNISRLPGVHVISSMEWQAVEDGLQMIKAKRMFEETRLLLIRGNETKETVMDKLGIKVKAIPRDTFNLRYNKMPVNEEVRDLASAMRRNAKKIVEPTEEDILNSVRAYTTAKRLLADEQANALSMDCLGMVTDKLVPTPPCGAWAMLQDEGITAGCEADLMGATSLMLTSYLLNRPGFMNDPVPETYRNTLIAAHCVSGTRLEGFNSAQAPYILRDHAESSLGVSMQVLWPEGQPVTLVDFSNPGEMVLDTGRVVSNINTPPAGGCRTQVEITMDKVEDSRDVKGFHQVVVLGDHRRMIESFSQLYGINVIHSPERFEHPKIEPVKT